MTFLRRRREPATSTARAALPVSIPSAVRVLRTELELREAVDRAEGTERRISEWASKRSGRYARLRETLDRKDDATRLRAVEPADDVDRQTG